MAKKEHFVAQLYKFMDDRGTPFNEVPTINDIDVDLYKLFKIVNNFGGYHKVNKGKLWMFVTNKAGYEEQSFFLVKHCYQQYLHSFECFMLNNSKGVRPYSKLNHSIIRSANKTGTNKNYTITKKIPKNVKSKETLKKIGKSVQNTNKKEKVVTENCVDTYNIIMQSETKEVIPTKSKISVLNYLIDKEEKATSNNLISSPVNIVTFDKDSSVIVGDNIAVYYGDEKDTTYDAKVIKVCENKGVIKYYVHYKGWNSRYDEWIDATRVASKTKIWEPQTEVGNCTDSSKSSSPEALSTTSRIRSPVTPLKSYSHIMKKSPFNSALPTRTSTLADHSLFTVDNSHTEREYTIHVETSNSMCYSLLSEDEEENQITESGSCEKSEREDTINVGTSNIMCYSLLSEDEDENELTESGSCKNSEREDTINVGTSNIMCYSLLSEDEDENELTESGSCKKSEREDTINVGTSNVICYSLLSEDEDENELTESELCKKSERENTINVGTSNVIICYSLLFEDEEENQLIESESYEKSESSELEHVSKSSKDGNEEIKLCSQNEIGYKVNAPNLNDKVFNFFMKQSEPNNIFSMSKPNENKIFDGDDDASKMVIIESDEIETDYQIYDNLVCEEHDLSNGHIQAQGQKFRIYSNIENCLSQNILYEYIDNIDDNKKSPIIENREIVESTAKCSINEPSNNDTSEQFEYEAQNAKDTFKKEKTIELLDFQLREKIVNEDTEYDKYKPSTSKGFSDSIHKPSTSKYGFCETGTNSFSGSRQTVKRVSSLDTNISGKSCSFVSSMSSSSSTNLNAHNNPMTYNLSKNCIPSTNKNYYYPESDVNSVRFCKKSIANSPASISEKQIDQDEKQKALQKENKSDPVKYDMNIVKYSNILQKDEVRNEKAEISGRNLKRIYEFTDNGQQLKIEPEKVVIKKLKSSQQLSNNTKSPEHSESTTSTSRIPVLDPEWRPAQRIPVIMAGINQVQLQYGKYKEKLTKILIIKKKIKKRNKEKAAATK